MQMRSCLLVCSLLAVPALGCDAADEPESIDIAFRPDIPVCSVCKITDDVALYELSLEIDEEYATATITDPAIAVIDPGTQNWLTASMAPLSVSTTSVTTVDLTEYKFDQNDEVVSDWLAEHTTVTTARLSLQVDTDGSGPNPPQTRTEDIDIEH